MHFLAPFRDYGSLLAHGNSAARRCLAWTSLVLVIGVSTIERKGAVGPRTSDVRAAAVDFTAMGELHGPGRPSADALG